MKNSKLKAAVILAVFVLCAAGIFVFDDGELFKKIWLEFKTDETSDSDSLTAYFIDVGQGDCELLVCGGKSLLIDCGEREESRTVIDFVSNLGIERLDFVVCTHPHADHMGAMGDVLRAFEVGEFYMTDIPDEKEPTTKAYEKMLEALVDKQTEVFSEDTSFEFGDAEVEIWFPKEYYKDLNDYSAIVKVTHGENSMIFTGDCEKAEEKELLNSDFDPKADVLKVAHHGSSSSCSKEFLDAVSPEYAVIELGEGNTYGHPHKETIDILSRYLDDQNVFRTDENGTVTIKSDKSELIIETER